MRDHTLDQFWSRINRVMQVVKSVSAEGHEQLHVLEDGTTHRYNVRGVKSPEQLEDELSALYVWTWSLKDYLKRAIKRGGANGQMIESIVNNCRALQLIADVANRIKHGGLRESRSGAFPELVDVGFTLPQTAISSITIGAFNVGIDVSDPTSAQLHARIRLADGTLLDAFEVLDEGLLKWETEAMPLAR